MNENNKDLKAELSIPFSCIEHAKIAYNTLKVDSEPRKELINKTLSLNEDTKSILVAWSAKESRILRVSINSFLDHLNSVIETIQAFELD